jgi:thiamine biosynthesis lipoprotein
VDIRKMNRREFVRITAIGAGILTVGGLGLKTLLEGDDFERFTETRTMLGTYITLNLIDVDAKQSKANAEDAFAEIARLSKIMSHHDPASELYRLNANGRITEASGELVNMIELAKYYNHLTQGAFDISVLTLVELYQESFRLSGHSPDDNSLAEALKLVDSDSIEVTNREINLNKLGMTLTLDGIAKGYIVDRAANVLRARGLTRVLVEAGGDVVLSGMREDDHPWRIGITHPRALTGYYEVIESSNGAIATSGDYESAYTADYSFHHIIDPRSGQCPSELSSATVLSSDTVSADALSTAVMVLGFEKGLALLEGLPGVEGFLIGKDLKSQGTSGFPTASLA